MSYLFRNGAAAVGGLALAFLLAASPVWADMEVMESNVPDLKVGTTLKDDATLKLPEKTTVRLLLASGATKTLKGPYEGTAADYEESKSWWEKLVGPAEDEAPPTGITRGLKKPE
jgi:hypothetical protein